MSGWFQQQIVHTGRLPLFCFFVAFVLCFGIIRLSVRLIRARVRWWPGDVVAGDVHVHHMVFGVVFMGAGGVAELAAPVYSLGWRSAAAVVFGLGTALVLDEFALILHLRDVYWSNEGRISVDAVFAAAGVTALLLLGVTPVGVTSAPDYQRLLPGTPGAVTTLHLAVAALFLLASITLLKGKIWTGLLGLFVPVVFIVGAVRLARPGSPWARWRYAGRPAKLARADRRERLLRQPVIRAKIRIQDVLTGRHDQPVLTARERQAPPVAGTAVLADPGAQAGEALDDAV
ncbi:MAG TPA: hypothetical protein VMF87_32735 [Streptosporangiaceae bacterium]|nr:hypothetical protein [Streptosporangiaceae bacterium]